ncbi:hypothetical protein TNCV_197521 [Trichonephila clavipes]|nr:hypothetical protein TNCV_197521 [Trichonephila clavipes]
MALYRSPLTVTLWPSSFLKKNSKAHKAHQTDYVKSLVYADKPQTLDLLEDNIRRVIAYIRPQMLEKVIENWTSRLDYIRASRGSHMPEIIFKIDLESEVNEDDIEELIMGHEDELMTEL